MDYHFENSDEISMDWEPAFEALSVPQFDYFLDELEFPFRPTDELRSIAKDYVIAFKSYIRKIPPEQPSIFLLDESNKDDPLLGVWHKTFIRLEKLGCAQTLFDWLVQSERVERKRPKGVSRTSDWNLLLRDWAMDRSPGSLLPLSLSPTTTSAFQLLLLRFLVKEFRLHDRVNRTKSMPRKSVWEQFAFERLIVGTWLSLQLKANLHLAKWHAIFDLLTAEEVLLVQEWGWRQFEKVGIHEQIPLEDFLRFREEG